ncbi:putative glutamine amidotransferase [Lachnellula subtilissima]|uniref:Putative glutamine amidotransferase n=1 Tax=Lachnellula subtilissima TaxID=602034 RepID=A0A8H8RQB4_9HELO|nr:putative glutamine amidotransferase [Lachnellula subtilissima]
MCRWFAYISQTSHVSSRTFSSVSPAHSLSKQIHQHYLPKLLSHDPATHAEPTTQAEITARNRLFNVDGFGTVWYSSALTAFSPSPAHPALHPVLYKTIQPPLHDANFRSICSNTASKVVFAHIRAATATAITPINNHPFTFGIHTIMHNGFISDFAAIKRKICEPMSQEAYSHIEGGTDTEHLAALFMSILCPASTSAANADGIPAAWEEYHTPQALRDALFKTIETIITVQTSLLGSKAQPNDLNVAVTDGQSLVACRFRNHPTEQPPSLYHSTAAGVTLNRQYPDHPDGAKGPHGKGDGISANGKQAAKGAEGHNPHARKNASEHGKHFIISSEPTTYKDAEWDLVEKNRVVLVGSEGLIGTETVSYPGDGRTK